MKVFHSKKNMSQELIALAWDTFFVSKNRGISFDVHFPWVKTDYNVWSVEVTHCGSVIAGLVVREKKVSLESGVKVIGCIGLVCVHPDYRGKGIANELFKNVISNALNKEYVALTLWTNQHQIYQSNGFSVCDRSVYGSVSYTRNGNRVVEQYELRSLPTGLGLPPFAKTGSLYVTNNAEISVLWDDKGGVIVDWSGDTTSITSLIKSIFPESFRINSRVECSIIKSLGREGCDINISNSNLQMWLPLSESVNICELEVLGSFGVLNRI